MCVRAHHDAPFSGTHPVRALREAPLPNFNYLNKPRFVFPNRIALLIAIIAKAVKVQARHSLNKRECTGTALTFFLYRGKIILSHIRQFGGVSLPFTAEELSSLARCPLFQGVAEHLVEKIAQEAVSLPFSLGEVIYSPRKFRRCLGILLSGQLQVTKGSLTVNILEPGELFGAAALYSDAPEFITTITARRPGRCLLLDQALVDQLLAEHPLLRRNYLCYLTGRVPRSFHSILRH